MFNTIRERGGVADTDTLTVEEIRATALANGFKLKQQPNGEMDLNPYVYKFVRAILIKAKYKGGQTGP